MNEPDSKRDDFKVEPYVPERDEAPEGSEQDCPGAGDDDE